MPTQTLKKEFIALYNSSYIIKARAYPQSRLEPAHAHPYRLRQQPHTQLNKGLTRLEEIKTDSEQCSQRAGTFRPIGLFRPVQASHFVVQATTGMVYGPPGLCGTCHSAYDSEYPYWVMVPTLDVLNRYTLHERKDYRGRVAAAARGEVVPRT